MQAFCGSAITSILNGYQQCPVFNFTVTPPPAGNNSASLTPLTAAPSSVSPGGTINLSVRATNTGSSTWSPVGTLSPPIANGVDYGKYYGWAVIVDASNPSVGVGEGNLLLPQAVSPGQTVQLQGSITAPTAPGNYAVFVEMNQLWVQASCGSASPAS